VLNAVGVRAPVPVEVLAVRVGGGVEDGVEVAGEDDVSVETSPSRG